MGNTTSCCVSSSPKLRRNAHSRLESYRPEAELSREDTGCNLQHISDRENIDGEGGRAGEPLLPSPPSLPFPSPRPGRGSVPGGCPAGGAGPAARTPSPRRGPVGRPRPPLWGSRGGVAVHLRGIYPPEPLLSPGRGVWDSPGQGWEHPPPLPPPRRILWRGAGFGGGAALPRPLSRQAGGGVVVALVTLSRPAGDPCGGMCGVSKADVGVR